MATLGAARSLYGRVLDLFDIRDDEVMLGFNTNASMFGYGTDLSIGMVASNVAFA